jgi:predicted phage terminase large subunit-like protein
MKSSAESLKFLQESEIAGANRDDAREYLALLTRLEFLEDQHENKDFATFARRAWEILEPATPFKWNWHLDLICEYLQLVRSGSLRRLIVNVPPQCSKSRLLTVFFPAWWWSTDPSRRFMSASYSGGALGLSTLHSLERRRVLESDWYRENFGNFEWTQLTQQQYENDAGGRMVATSTGATATGKGFHCMILDDILNPKKAESDLERITALDFFDKTLRSRLSDQITGSIIVVEQRLHERDLTGHLLETEKEAWTHVKIPMVAEEDEVWKLPISGRVVRRKKGDLLWPERFPQWVIDSLKTMGTRAWSSQYQQRPAPAEGIIFNPSHWRYYVRDPAKAHDEVVAAPMFDDGAITVDCSFKDSTDTDLVAIQAWGFVGIRSYLWRKDTKRRGYTATKMAIREMKYEMNLAGLPCNYCLIEDKANGSAVMDEFKRDDEIGMSVIAVEPLGGKIARAWAAQPEQEAGHCYLPEDDDETPRFVGDSGKFPTIPHDDDIDAFTQLINWRRSRMSGLFELWKQEHDARGNAEQKRRTETLEESTMSLAEAQKQEADDEGKLGLDKVQRSSMSKPLVVPQIDRCPKCGNVNLSRTAGAVVCGGCGWKKNTLPK